MHDTVRLQRWHDLLARNVLNQDIRKEEVPLSERLFAKALICHGKSVNHELKFKASSILLCSSRWLARGRDSQ